MVSTSRSLPSTVRMPLSVMRSMVSVTSSTLSRLNAG
jgi:hypothetical protein